MRAVFALFELALIRVSAAILTTASDPIGAQLANDSSPLVLSAAVPPELWKLRQRYEHLVAQDQDASGNYRRSPMAGRVKLLVGIFSMVNAPLWQLDDREARIRQIIRETWMDHPDVCSFPNFTRGCTIHVVFVACQGKNTNVRDGRFKKSWRGSEWKLTEQDVLLMPFNENMNSGKTFEWFKFAAANFPKMDYIGKADTDVFLHVTKVINGLRTAKQNIALTRQRSLNSGCNAHGEAFYGKPWTCKLLADCPPRSCGPPVGDDFMRFVNEDQAEGVCFTYMQGGFYAISQSIAENITADGGYFEQHKNGPEDLRTGRAVFEYAARTNNCVSIWMKEQTRYDEMYHHLRGLNEHPGNINPAWDEYYNPVPKTVNYDELESEDEEEKVEDESRDESGMYSDEKDDDVDPQTYDQHKYGPQEDEPATPTYRLEDAKSWEEEDDRDDGKRNWWDEHQREEEDEMRDAEEWEEEDEEEEVEYDIAWE